MQLARVFNEISSEKQVEAYARVLEEIESAGFMKKNPDAKVPASNLTELKKKAMTDL